MLVNTIDPSKSKFEVWISIGGLTFDRRDTDNFDKIGRFYEGMLEVDSQSLDFSNLTKAKIKVQSSRAADIPHVIYQNVGEQWILI